MSTEPVFAPGTHYRLRVRSAEMPPCPQCGATYEEQRGAALESRRIKAGTECKILRASTHVRCEVCNQSSPVDGHYVVYNAELGTCSVPFTWLEPLGEEAR